jgi:hypothetical protein
MPEPLGGGRLIFDPMYRRIVFVRCGILLQFIGCRHVLHGRPLPPDQRALRDGRGKSAFAHDPRKRHFLGRCIWRDVTVYLFLDVRGWSVFFSVDSRACL